MKDGIAEIVSHSSNGFQCDPRNLEKVSSHLRDMSDPDTYQKMCQQSIIRIQQYNERTFISTSLRILDYSVDGIPFHLMEFRDKKTA